MDVTVATQARMLLEASMVSTDRDMPVVVDLSVTLKRRPRGS